MDRTTSRPRRDLSSGLVLALVLLALGACVSIDSLPKPDNFGEVVDHDIYRGAQPQPEDFKLLRRLGVKTILKLNTSRVEMETTAAREAGIKLIHVPFDAAEIGRESTCEDVARAMDVLMDESNWPIYVHCSRGRDRAGYMVGLYRQVVQNWTWEQIDQELLVYGHDEDMREAYPQIVRELRAGAPSCSTVVEEAVQSGASR